MTLGTKEDVPFSVDVMGITISTAASNISYCSRVFLFRPECFSEDGRQSRKAPVEVLRGDFCE